MRDVEYLRRRGFKPDVGKWNRWQIWKEWNANPLLQFFVCLYLVRLRVVHPLTYGLTRSPIELSWIAKIVKCISIFMFLVLLSHQPESLKLSLNNCRQWLNSSPVKIHFGMGHMFWPAKAQKADISFLRKARIITLSRCWAWRNGSCPVCTVSPECRLASGSELHRPKTWDQMTRQWQVCNHNHQLGNSSPPFQQP